MKGKCRFLAVFVIISVFLALAAFALDDIYPDDVTGEYSYTYYGEANKIYSVFVIAGADAPSFGLTADYETLYYGRFKADSAGKVAISFIPKFYKDATMFISADGMSGVQKVCNVLKGDEIQNVARIKLAINKDEFVSDGVNDITIKYTVVAYDSFGFESIPEEPIEFLIETESGDPVTGFHLVSSELETVTVLADIPEGTYKLVAKSGDVRKDVVFSVERAESEAEELEVFLNGESTSLLKYFDGMFRNDVNGGAFEPEYYEIAPKTYDQYGDAVPDEYYFTYAKMINDKAGEKVNLQAGKSVKFYPPDKPAIDETVKYQITVTSKKDKSFYDKFYIYIKGYTAYKSSVLSFYRVYYSSEQDCYNKIQSGEIVAASNGNSVPASKRWTTQEYIDTFVQAFEHAREILIRADGGEAFTDDELLRERQALSQATKTFEKTLAQGRYNPIRSIMFEEPNIDVPLGKNKTVRAITDPERPSDAVKYRSADPTIAKVYEDGKVEGISEGTTTIYASNESEEISTSYLVTVFKAITSFRYLKNEITTSAGVVLNPDVYIYPLDHSDTITYKSSKTKVASVDKKGNITVHTPGEATITATTKMGLTSYVDIIAVAPEFTANNARVVPGGRTSVYVEAKNGYDFANITLDIVSESEDLWVESVKDLELVKGFDNIIEYQASPVNVRWLNEKNSGVINGRIAEIVFKAADDAEYQNIKITVNVKVTNEKGEELVIDGASLEKTVLIGETDTYNVRLTPNTGGTISKGPGDYAYDTEVKLVASPNNGYLFEGWFDVNDKMVSNENPYTIVVRSDVYYRAKFKKSGPSYVSGGGGGGGSSGGGGGGGGGGSTVVQQQVSAVVANIPSGEIAKGTLVTLSTATLGARIYYTTDGSFPNTSSRIYSQPIPIVENGTIIRAIAAKSGMTNSTVAAFTYRCLEEAEVTAKITLKPDASTIKYISSSSPYPYIRPNDYATRYEVIDMTNRLFDITGVEKRITFPDLSGELAETVALFAGAGIINGYPDGTFKGNDGITRAEFVKIVGIMLGLPESNDENVSLWDISGHWAEGRIKSFVAKGYILGYPEGDFRPDNPIARSEVVTILNRVAGISNSECELEQYYEDLPKDHWAFAAIMNAAYIPQNQ